MVFPILLSNPMSLFRQALLQGPVQPTLATLHHKVFTVGAFWHKDQGKRPPKFGSESTTMSLV
ncbi:MAG: hypothetical protein ABIR84_02970 [Candidatus Nitrotoga sp.]